MSCPQKIEQYVQDRMNLAVKIEMNEHFRDPLHIIPRIPHNSFASFACQRYQDFLSWPFHDKFFLSFFSMGCFSLHCRDLINLLVNQKYKIVIMKAYP